MGNRIGVAVLLAVSAATGQTPSRSQLPDQRLPRQTAPTRAAMQGMFKNPAGAALGGVTVTLIMLSNGKSLPTLMTTGDGVFRVGGLPPGRYQVRATNGCYEPFEQGDITIPAGEVYVLEAVLKPRSPLPATCGPAVKPEITAEPAESSYHSLIPSPAESAGPNPLEPLPPDHLIFQPVGNRWPYEFPAYRRYNQKGEYINVDRHWYDPFNRNKLKGDYPIFGNRTFLNITATSDTFFEGRRLPTPSNVDTDRPDSANFFGRFGQLFTSENVAFTLDLFRGDAAFRPFDWRIRITPEVNVNYFLAKENGIVNADPSKGRTRLDSHGSLQEAFFEIKLADLSHEFDFVSARAGIQGFNSDFRGFIFSDQEPGLRIFGNLKSNRYQYNLAYFAMLEKDSNSGLNTFNYRHQQVMIANLYRQDFLKPGYTIQGSFHYDKDDPSFQFDTNNFLVRPSPVGNVKVHNIRAYYLGVTGDGHFGRMNITHAFYQVFGHDSFNSIAGRRVGINAQMAAVELSIDKDWIRYRTSFFFSSGEKHPTINPLTDKKVQQTVHGFDAIFDNPTFAGGIFSFWNREGIRLTGSGVGLTSPDSLLPSLRSSKIQGQANFVNPGLFLYNGGIDIDITPKLRGFLNTNLVRFQYTAPIETVLFQKPIHAGVGADYGLGATYRPPLSDNIIITAGVSAFAPFQGFRDIYTGQTLFSAFANVRFRF